MRTVLYSVLLFGCLSACVSLKPYERQYVNDPEMDINPDAGKGFINYANSIREGATIPGSTKGSGGCGCN